MEEKEKREIERERKEWAYCGVCGEEYSEDIRINPRCLHSYCYQCVLASSSSSSLCPLCGEPLPRDISTLPHNIILQQWHSLSPSPSPSPSSSGAAAAIVEECPRHEMKKKEMYCTHCDEILCGECAEEEGGHSQHQVITVEEYIRQVKEGWKREFDEEYNRFTDANDLVGEELNCIVKLGEAEDEVKRLEECIRRKKEEALRLLSLLHLPSSPS